jgi:hypothetical protein
MKQTLGKDNYLVCIRHGERFLISDFLLDEILLLEKTNHHQGIHVFRLDHGGFKFVWTYVT